MEKFGKFFLGALTLFVLSVLGGYVLMKLWEWLIVYAFFVNPINLIQSIGLMVFFNFIKPTIKDKEELTWMRFIETTTTKLVWYGVALLLGYLVTLFQ